MFDTNSQFITGNNMLHFYKEEKTSNGYGATHTKRKKIDFDQYLIQVTDVYGADYFCVDTIIDAPIFGRTAHLLVLDCDGTGEMLAATNTLATRNIGYALIQSSPSKYWIVTDVIDSFPNIYRVLKSIPGIDRNHIKFAEEHKQLFIRAYPRGFKPLFPDVHTLKTDKVIEWYTQFEKLWDRPELVNRCDAERLKAQLEDGSILAAAANPEFQL